MKRSIVKHAYVFFIVMLTGFLVWGCGGGGGDGSGHWDSDDNAPFVIDESPADGSIGAPLNTTVTATFNEAMEPTTLTETTFTLKRGIVAVSGEVNYAGVTAVFTPDVPLLMNTEYTATITTGAEDESGNPLASNYVWSFNTLDTVPTVTATTNAHGAVNVPVNTAVGATFSEVMDASTFTGLTFTMRKTLDSSVIAGALDYTGVNAVFIPDVDLEFTTRYTITVKGGASGVKDLTNNPMATDYVWSWTTGAAADTTPPTVTGTVNDDGAINVPINTTVGATFSEAMDPLTITDLTFLMKEKLSGTPVDGALDYAGVNAVFVPSLLLLPDTEYTITVKGGVGGVEDLAGNPKLADYIWSWTTGAILDETAPTVVLTSPVDGATDATLNGNVSATFSEPMAPLTITNVTFSLKKTSDNSDVPGVIDSYDLLTKTAVFNPTNNLAPGTEYTATITSMVTDLAGNPLLVPAVTLPPNPWTFTTADAALAPGAVDLGAAQPYGVLAGLAITLGGGDLTGLRVDGDVGISPGSTCNGCTPIQVSGAIEIATAPAAAAKAALVTAYDDAMGRVVDVCTLVASGELTANPSPTCGGSSNGTFAPGLYWAATSMGIMAGGTITLDAGNDPDAVFIFQAGSTINSLADSHVVLANLAQAKNVFWVAGSSATIGGVGADFAGTVMALEDFTVNTDTQMLGRALARNGSVTVQDGALITVPAP